MIGNWKRFQITTALLSIQNIIIINLFRLVFIVPVCSVQREIFVIACVLEIMHFDYFNYFNCIYLESTSLPTSIIKPSTHRAFTCSKSTIETLEQGAKSVQIFQACNFIKKKLQHRYFLVNIGKSLRAPILKNICEYF